jgi:N-acetylated-alpha-linked acidic dipeptidase
LIIASWDAEEYGIVGSTEFVEDFAQELREKGAVYINTDSGVSGTKFKASASPSLAEYLKKVTMDVQDPISFKSVYEEWVKSSNEWGSTHADSHSSAVNSSSDAYVGPLGFGSDYVGFLQHIGIASIDIKFQGAYGVYHSNYDSYHWMEKFGDPTFEYHAALSTILGLLAMRMTDSEVLPFQFKTYSVSLHEYTQELQSLLNGSELKSIVNLSLLESAIQEYTNAAERVDQEILSSKESFNLCGNHYLHLQMEACNKDAATDQNRLNDKLMFAERHLLDPNGIPGRQWYKHIIYAP